MQNRSDCGRRESGETIILAAISAKCASARFVFFNATGRMSVSKFFEMQAN